MKLFASTQKRSVNYVMASWLQKQLAVYIPSKRRKSTGPSNVTWNISYRLKILTSIQ